MNLKLLSLGRIGIRLLTDGCLSKLAYHRLNPVWIFAMLVWLTAAGCSYLSPEPAPSPSQTNMPERATAHSPKPTATAHSPKPTATAHSPKPTATAHSPKPTATAHSPKPTATAQPVPTIDSLPSPIPTQPPVTTLSPSIPQASHTVADRRPGGILNLAIGANIAHQDVHLDVSPALSTWGPGLAYSRLLRFKSGLDVELPSRTVECDLCESWDMDGPRSYLFRLREGVRWQVIEPVHGRDLTAEDISFSYFRQSQPGFPNAPLLHNIDTIQTLTSLEFRITLVSPDVDFLGALAEGHTKVVNRDAVELTGDLREGPTVGTGPWVLESTIADESHLFSRNINYFERGLPLLDGMQVHILPDTMTQTAAFKVGIVDVHQMRPDEWKEHIQREPLAQYKLVKHPGTGLEVALNTNRPPFDDVRVRQAVFLAINPMKAIEEYWGGFAFVSMGFLVERADWLPTEDDIQRYLNRPTDALALFQDAGISDPVPVTIRVGQFGSAYLAHAASIAREMAKVGFVPEVEVMNRREFGEKVWLGGDYQMFAGPAPPVASPNGFLLPVLHSNGIWNTTGHVDDELDILLETQAIAIDANLRSKTIRKIRQRVLQKAYRFMPAAAVAIWTWQPHVADFHPNFTGSEYYHWTRVWLDG